ncbi:hypothetical protein ACFLQG_01765 [Candidatus Zixiibacteriota bacterium]
MNRIPYVLTFVILLLLSPVTLQAADWQLTTNLGYDYISQEFFADSVILQGTDSSIVEWEQKKDYLDDLRASLSLLYSPYEDHRLELRQSYEQSREFIRIRFNSNFRLPVGDSRFDFISEFELKHRYYNEVNPGDNYLLGLVRTRFTIPLTNSTKGWFQLRGDFVSFDSTSTYIYNYKTAGGAIGLSKTLGSFTYADADLFINRSSVPDSTQLDYINFGFNMSLVSYYLKGSFDLYARGESKNFNQPGNEDDQYRFYLQIRNKYHPTGNIYLRQECNLESVRYNPVDITNFNYTNIKAEMVIGLSLGNSQFGLGPAFAILKDGASELGAGQEYSEFSLKTEYDYFSGSRLFLSAESFTGKRYYNLESEYQTDFVFERISLIGNLTIIKNVSLNLLYFAEWEWHDNESDNSRIDLISTSFSYTF